MIASFLDRPCEHAALRTAARDLGVWSRISRSRLSVRPGPGVWHSGLSGCSRRSAGPVEVRAVSSLTGTWCRCLVVSAGDLWSPWRSGSSAWLSTLFYYVRVTSLLDALAQKRRVALMRELSALVGDAPEEALSSHSLSAEQGDLLREVTSSLRRRAEAALADPTARSKRRRLAFAALVRGFRLDALVLDEEELLVGTSLDLARLRRVNPLLGDLVDACTLVSAPGRTVLSMPRYAYDVLQRNGAARVDARSLQATRMRPCDLEVLVTLWDPASDGALCDLSRAVDAAVLA